MNAKPWRTRQRHALQDIYVADGDSGWLRCVPSLRYKPYHHCWRSEGIWPLFPNFPIQKYLQLDKSGNMRTFNPSWHRSLLPWKHTPPTHHQNPIELQGLVIQLSHTAVFAIARAAHATSTRDHVNAGIVLEHGETTGFFSRSCSRFCNSHSNHNRKVLIWIYIICWIIFSL